MFMSDWFCYKCDGNMKDADICPYCGNGRYESDNNPTAFHYAKAKKILNATREEKVRRKTIFNTPIFSLEERLALGMYPKKEIYKMSLISLILGKKRT